MAMGQWVKRALLLGFTTALALVQYFVFYRELTGLASYAHGLQKVIWSGPPSNRVDIVFVGEGYTSDEQGAFAKDIDDLVGPIFHTESYESVLPALNIWSYFVPSQESGIGVGGEAKDTAFGIYRNGTELRGLHVSKIDRAHQLCAQLRLSHACDYIVIVANDRLYGGIGGEVVAITASSLNGATVARHELGHNLIGHSGTGDEYDGGDASSYFGANAATDIRHLPWSHWLTDKSSVREQDIDVPFQQYIWGPFPFCARFSSKHSHTKYLIRATVSGIAERSQLRVVLDGQELDWWPTHTPDRLKFEWTSELKGTEHSISFFQPVMSGGHPQQLAFDANRVPVQMCEIDVVTYGDDAILDNSYIGAYPTFNEQKAKHYRPSNEGCAMRNVTSTQFCAPCKEALVRNILSRVNLVDALQVIDASSLSSGDQVAVDLKLLSFAHMRKHSATAKEHYSIRWYLDGEEVSRFANRTHLRGPHDEMTGLWKVHVKLHTSEVRLDPNKTLETTKFLRIG